MAKADGKIQNKETNKFYDIINEEVTSLCRSIGLNEKDESSDTALEFELMDKKNATSEETYNSFVDFYGENKHKFNNGRKSEVLSFATRIAKSFEGVSKKEKQLIEKLKHEFLNDN